MKRLLLSIILFFSSATLFAQHIYPSIDHISFHVKNYTKSISFYGEVLGLDTVSSPYKSENKITRFKLGPNLQLHIIAGGVRDIVQMNHSHVTFLTDSVELFTKKLDSLHIKWFSKGKRRLISIEPDGVKQIFFRDPDGYELEVNTAGKRLNYVSL